jgi:hypothetical protein
MGMHSYHTLESLTADRLQEIFRNAPSHNLAAEPRQPGTSKLPNWWAGKRCSGRVNGRWTVVALASLAAR